MTKLSADGLKVLETLLSIDTGMRHERQSHTDRAIASAAKLDAERAASACSELAEAGYITSANAAHWDNAAPSLSSFRLTPRGREALS